MATRRGRSAQADLFLRTMRPMVPIDENHPLAVLADEIDWTDLEILAEKIRREKHKNNAGRPPQLRVLLGAMVLRSIRYVPYRVLEEQIRHYAPARYVCGLTETDWTPDHNTLHDFFKLMGEEGTRLINELVVKRAVKEGLADPTCLVADTTAQEAAIPYPNEIGLMAAFIATVAGASKKAGKVFKEFAAKTKNTLEKAKEKAREYQLFAKTKKSKDQMMAQLVELVAKVQTALGKAVKRAKAVPSRLTKHRKVAKAKLIELNDTMEKLLPQIRHWLETGHVAKGKIVSLHIPELYSIVRGKVGKKVEFGRTWGISRLRGGFIFATVASSKNELHDSKYVLSAVDEHTNRFGEPPKEYAYDRGGWSAENVAKLKQDKGVEQVGLAPRGSAEWAVNQATKKRLISERAQVEGSIGTIKHLKYGFNRPAAKSAEMMGTCGQLAVLGCNLNKLVRGLCQQREEELAG